MPGTMDCAACPAIAQVGTYVSDTGASADRMQIRNLALRTTRANQNDDHACDAECEREWRIGGGVQLSLWKLRRGLEENLKRSSGHRYRAQKREHVAIGNNG